MLHWNQGGTKDVLGRVPWLHDSDYLEFEILTEKPTTIIFRTKNVVVGTLTSEWIGDARPYVSLQGHDFGKPRVLRIETLIE